MAFRVYGARVLYQRVVAVRIMYRVCIVFALLALSLIHSLKCGLFFYVTSLIFCDLKV